MSFIFLFVIYCMKVCLFVLSSCLNVALELFGVQKYQKYRKYQRWLDVWTDFGFSFDVALTIDMILYYRGFGDVGDRRRERS